MALLGRGFLLFELESLRKVERVFAKGKKRLNENFLHLKWGVFDKELKLRRLR